MATPVIMPRQGQSVESCIIAKWEKKPGDEVAIGDVLFTYETDKATFDEEAKVAGTLLDIFFQEGDDVPCLLNVCVIGKVGEDASVFNPNLKQPEENQALQGVVAEKSDAVQEKETAIITEPDMTHPDGKLKISPRAKNLAEKTGADLRFAKPSGPNGRIIERDIVELRETGHLITSAAQDQYMNADTGITSGTGISGRITVDDLKAKVESDKAIPQTTMPQMASKSEFEEVKLTNIRKVIAKAMHHSISSTAQLTLNSSFDASDILSFRKKLKEGSKYSGLDNITINDIIIYAVSRTILNHKTINAHFLDDKMLLFNDANIGIAVDTERGLMVPTLFKANQKSLNEISIETKKLVESCQKGTINPDALKGGTFTITNLGTLDIESFTPVINPPQTGILGVNNITQRVKEVDGEYKYYPAMGLSLTFDHRALDGAPAARFLKDLKINLENFSIMLAK